MEKNNENTMKLFVTSNYGMFKTHITNRNLHEKTVLQMMRSIVKYGLIQPIIVSSDGYVIDGQHRLSASMRLNLPITYVVNYKISSKAVMEANNTQRKWTSDDWIKHYAEQGNADYRLLREKIQYWDKIFTSGKVQHAYYETAMSVSTPIKNGTYKLNEILGDQLLDNCCKMKQIFSDAFHTRFVRALKTVMSRNDNFNIDILLKNSTKKKLHFFYNEADVVDEIIEVYNFKINKEYKIE